MKVSDEVGDNYRDLPPGYQSGFDNDLVPVAGRLKYSNSIRNDVTDESRADKQTIQLMSVNEYLAHAQKLTRIKRKRKSATTGRENGCSTFLNRVVTHFGEYRAALESNSHEVATCVEQLVQQLLKVVAAQDGRFVGRLRASGSYYEGLKLQYPNEYNYLLEISPDSLRFEDLQLAHVVPETPSPRTQPNVYGRSYFRASFKGPVPRPWRCSSCIIDKCSSCPHRKDIDPRRIQKEFSDAVRTAMLMSNSDWSNADISYSGSALTIYSKIDTDVASRSLLNRHGLNKVQQHRNVGYFVVKIRITLAIPVEKRDPSMTWPLEGYGDLELDPDIAGQCVDIRKCHLVLAGDFWQVSFDHLERRLMRKLTEDPGKKKCLQAIKYLRDQVSVSDPSVDSSLSSQSLILSFFKENRRQDKEEKWRFWSLSQRVRIMLSNVEQRKATSYIMNDEVAPKESEQLLADCRRIGQYLDKLDRVYAINGCVHFVFMLLLFVSHLLLFSLSAVYLSPIKHQRASCDDPATASRLHIGSYAHLHLPLSVAAVILSGIGALWITIQRTLVQSYNVLYDMYRGILYVYIIMAALDTLLVAFGVGLAVLIDDFFASGCSVWRADAVVGLTWCTLCVAAVVVLAMCSHLVFYVVSVRGKLIQYKWEIVLSDFIYKEAFSCLRRNTRDPPRVSVSVNKKESVADDTDTDSDCDVTDMSLSTLERKYKQNQKQNKACLREAPSLSLSPPDAYDCYQGRFDPISPMQSIARRSSGSACASSQHSPAYVLPPYGDSDIASWPSTNQCPGYPGSFERQSPLATAAGVLRIHDYPETLLAPPSDILDLSSQSLQSSSSASKPHATITRNGGSMYRKQANLSSQILDPRTLNNSFRPISAGNSSPMPAANASSSEPCLPAAYCRTENDAINSTYVPKQYCRFIDVAI